MGGPILGAAHFFFLRLGLVLNAADFPDELLLELRRFLIFSFGGSSSDFVAQKKFLSRDLGFGRHLDFGNGGFLFVGELPGRGLLLQPFHGEFVSGFHERVN